MGAHHLSRSASLVAVLLLAACGHRERPEPAPEPAPVAAAPKPLPPPGAAPGQTLPEADAATINSGIGAQEALWHARAALNVAALGCGSDAVIARYNAFLATERPALARAYAADAAAHPAPGELDRHMTQLYNFFAQPPAQRGFCAAAAAVTERAAAPGADQTAVVGAALPEFEAPVLDYYRAYAAYRRDLAGWEQQGGDAAAARTMVAAASPPVVTPAPTTPWRIQIGAFTGRAAAEAAWARAKVKAPSLGQYEPRYEEVPGRALVRVQVGAAADRGGALRLCASAAAGGFDCIPVVPGR